MNVPRIFPECSLNLPLLWQLRPALMRSKGWAEPESLLRKMWAWGYTDISHSGPVCDLRWNNVTSLHHRRSERKKMAIASAVLYIA
jgi:hypothetical protein